MRVDKVWRDESCELRSSRHQAKRVRFTGPFAQEAGARNSSMGSWKPPFRSPALAIFAFTLASIAAAVPLATLSVSAESSGEHLRKGYFQGRPALILSNDVLELTVLPDGGGLASVTLRDDPEKINPLWDSIRAAREAGRPMWAPGYVGHFVCVDGFGPASEDESKAGLPGHGEAHALPWTTESSSKRGAVAKLVQAVHLPRVQEVLRRTLTVVDGENVVYVQSSLENLLSFDRPIHWTEHATIGSPFLQPGVTVVDISRNRALTRPDQKSLDDLPHRLPAGKEFTWPMAPGVDGGIVDMRVTPSSPNSLDHSGYLMNPTKNHAFVTALNPGKRLLFGYVFKSFESPWLQIWEYYPPEGVMARGLEFGTQAFGLPRREVVTQNKLFDTLLYRWLPAKSKIETSFLLFWTRTPEGFQGVDDIQLEDGELRVRDGRSGQILTVKASQPW